MTEEEKYTMKLLVEFWNEYLKLPGVQEEHAKTVCESIHVIQGIMAIRVAARVNPEIWRIGDA